MSHEQDQPDSNTLVVGEDPNKAAIEQLLSLDSSKGEAELETVETPPTVQPEEQSVVKVKVEKVPKGTRDPLFPRAQFSVKGFGYEVYYVNMKAPHKKSVVLTGTPKNHDGSADPLMKDFVFVVGGYVYKVKTVRSRGRRVLSRVGRAVEEVVNG